MFHVCERKSDNMKFVIFAFRAQARGGDQIASRYAGSSHALHMHFIEPIIQPNVSRTF